MEKNALPPAEQLLAAFDNSERNRLLEQTTLIGRLGTNSVRRHPSIRLRDVVMRIADPYDPGDRWLGEHRSARGLVSV